MENYTQKFFESEHYQEKALFGNAASQLKKLQKAISEANSDIAQIEKVLQNGKNQTLKNNLQQGADALAQMKQLNADFGKFLASQEVADMIATLDSNTGLLGGQKDKTKASSNYLKYQADDDLAAKMAARRARLAQQQESQKYTELFGFGKKGPKGNKEADQATVQKTAQELAEKSKAWKAGLDNIKSQINATGNTGVEKVLRKLGSTALLIGGLVSLTSFIFPPAAAIGAALMSGGSLANGAGSIRKDVTANDKAGIAKDVLSMAAGGAGIAGTLGKAAAIGRAGKYASSAKGMLNSVNNAKKQAAAGNNGMALISLLGGLGAAVGMGKLLQGDLGVTEIVDANVDGLVNEVGADTVEQAVPVAPEAEIIPPEEVPDVDPREFIPNTHEAASDPANIGKYLQRDDGTVVEITDKDVAWEKNFIAKLNNPQPNAVVEPEKVQQVITQASKATNTSAIDQMENNLWNLEGKSLSNGNSVLSMKHFVDEGLYDEAETSGATYTYVSDNVAKVDFPDGRKITLLTGENPNAPVSTIGGVPEGVDNSILPPSDEQLAAAEVPEQPAPEVAPTKPSVADWYTNYTQKNTEMLLDNVGNNVKGFGKVITQSEWEDAMNNSPDGGARGAIKALLGKNVSGFASSSTNSEFNTISSNGRPLVTIIPDERLQVETPEVAAPEVAEVPSVNADNLGITPEGAQANVDAFIAAETPQVGILDNGVPPNASVSYGANFQLPEGGPGINHIAVDGQDMSAVTYPDGQTFVPYYSGNDVGYYQVTDAGLQPVSDPDLLEKLDASKLADQQAFKNAGWKSINDGKNFYYQRGNELRLVEPGPQGRYQYTKV